jgi:hypothetical protein
MYKKMTPEEIIEKVKLQKQIREEKIANIPSEFRCQMSYTGAHMFNVFPDGDNKFIAICNRCLKRVPITSV